MPDVKKLETALPVAPLKLIAMQSAKNLGSKVNDYLVWNVSVSVPERERLFSMKVSVGRTFIFS